MPIALLFIALLHRGADADTTFHLTRGASVEINSQNRSVTLHVGTGDVVTVRGASGELDGRTLQIDGDNDGSHGNRRRGNASPSNAGAIDITVPAWTEVEIDVVTGNLTFDGSPAKLQAETVNGSIRMTGGTGSAELSSVNGTITVSDFHGTELSLSTNNDGITVTNATGALHVDGVTGDVVLRGIRSSDVEVSSVNGEVEFDGPLAADGKYDFESHNGQVTLYLPADVSARMRVSTFNGEFVSSDIPATTTGGRSVTSIGGKEKHKGNDGEQEFAVTYGRGDAKVTIDSFNGDVVVKKGPAPARRE